MKKSQPPLVEEELNVTEFLPPKTKVRPQRFDLHADFENHT